jgi:hypothetical protein
MVSSFPGFVEQRLMPPNPPLQADWVILQPPMVGSFAAGEYIRLSSRQFGRNKSPPQANINKVGSVVRFCLPRFGTPLPQLRPNYYACIDTGWA